MKILVLHHDDADGFGAAYALNHFLPGECTFIPVQYGQEPPNVTGYDLLYIVDFSYKREVMECLHDLMDGKIVCLDHHKTAEAELKGLDYCIFDQNYSGAVLTWDFVSVGDEAIPEILLYVQDRDLWKFELPDSKAVNAYIATLPNDFAAWDAFDLETAKQAGYAILAFQEGQIRSRMKDVQLVKFSKHLETGKCALGDTVCWPPLYSEATKSYIPQKETFQIPIVNASENISELGNELCKAYPDSPFSMSYCDRADGSRSYSLRSIGDFDVSEVAKAFGGGGHKNAAGFTLPAPEILS